MIMDDLIRQHTGKYVENRFDEVSPGTLVKYYFCEKIDFGIFDLEEASFTSKNVWTHIQSCQWVLTHVLTSDCPYLIWIIHYFDHSESIKSRKSRYDTFVRKSILGFST